ncbi:MAG: bifunctional demethylmenaquinone methyltransferase/2-methoxy-6-polyprenyl-1,4-benzoquinol methylase UbiE [Pseudomonadota bacterium]
MNRELDFIKEMFDSIAPRYDFLNRFLSLRQDVLWRREMVAAAGITSESSILDVACGTCDVGLEIRKQAGTTPLIFGTDFSPGMLALGRKKVQSLDRMGPIPLAAGNALCLPFKDQHFNAVMIAFGIRNIMDRTGALSEFHRVLKPGGRLAVLELTTPEQGLFREFYLAYFKRILPALGGLFSKNANAYQYLPASVLRFPAPEQFALLMKQAGFTGLRWKPMTLGIVTLFVGTRSR